MSTPELRQETSTALPRSRWNGLRRLLLLGGALFLVLGTLAPFVQVNRFGDRVRVGLENALHRKVRIGDVHFNLFTGPGFSVNDVLIEEDPAFGVEPIASVNQLTARVGITTLWTGKLEFSSLTLEEPSVNLSKEGDGPWNLVRMLQQSPLQSGGGAGGLRTSRLPQIYVRSGRINFKFGDRKSAFYLTNADADLSPSGADGASFELSFEGEPARTDTTAQSFGMIRGRGQWESRTDKPGELNLTLELAKSNIGEMTRLLKGRDFGLHGMVASRAELRGPLSDLLVKGQLQISDIHRWDAMPAARGGEWRLNYEGKANWQAETLDLSASTKLNPGVPIDSRLRAHGLLTSPRLATTFTLDGLPASGIVEVLRHIGAQIPPALEVDGKLHGVLGYSTVAGVQGQFEVQDASLRSGKSRELRLSAAECRLERDRLFVLPSEVALDDRQKATVEAELGLMGAYLRLQVRGQGLEVAALQSSAAALLPQATIPWIDTLQGGTWTGAFSYVQQPERAPSWTGAFDLRNAAAKVPGIADPVRLQAALVELQGDQLAIRRMKAATGKLAFEGDYRFDAESKNLHRVKLTAATADLAELERLFTPALQRRQGFLARTLRIGGAELPAWLRNRRVEGTLRIGKLSAGPSTLENVRGRLVWEGVQVKLEDLRSTIDGGDLTGSANLDLAGAEPKYKLRAKVQNILWKNGRLDLEGRAEFAGLGPSALASMRSEGTFQARSVDLLADNPIKAVTGAYALEFTSGGPKVVLRSVEASLAGDRYSGEGATQPGGLLQLDLSSGSRVLHIAGPVMPLKLDVVAAQTPSRLETQR
jgi:uncharacterized protein involved in outer membrane biogenesis